MTLQVTALVLVAALLHASWNALLRGASDRLWSLAIMCAAIALACAAAAPFLPLPASASWPYLAGSAALHVGYNLFLVRTYRSGDFGQTYPIARGSSPLLVTLGAAAFAGERLGTVSTLGVLLVCGGIISLAFRGRHPAVSSLPYALGTGCFIGAYSVTDGLGARLSGNVAAYTTWLCLIWGALIPSIYIALRGWRTLRRSARETLVAGGGGIVSLLAYGIVILAMSLGPMGPVSALRETSVVFAVLLGRLFLHEKLTIRRLAACVIIAAGAMCLGQSARAAVAPPNICDGKIGGCISSPAQFPFGSSPRRRQITL
jgi:drug/metabolite transporter (DMT)-like permease